MEYATPAVLVRMLPVALVALTAAVAINVVQEQGPWVLRNWLPLGVLVLLCWLTLARGRGRWTGDGWRMPLGVIGFAIPALGLSAYLHYAYTVNLDGMFDLGPGELFRFLPVYTLVAGAIGFAIGWIVGRRVV